MSRENVIAKLSEDLDEKTGYLGYDGYFYLPEQGDSFKIVITPAPGRHTVPGKSVIDAVIKVVKSHFPSECVSTMEACGKSYPHGSYIITVSDYNRYHD